MLAYVYGVLKAQELPSTCSFCGFQEWAFGMPSVCVGKQEADVTEERQIRHADRGKPTIERCV